MTTNAQASFNDMGRVTVQASPLREDARSWGARMEQLDLATWAREHGCPVTAAQLETVKQAEGHRLFEGSAR